MTSLAISLSDSYITVSTSADYVRIYTLFGTPFRVYRQKSQTVTCASWRDYVLTIGNGPVGGDGMTKLAYTIENVRRDEVYQNEDTVALTADSELRNVFFADTGVCFLLSPLLTGLILLICSPQDPCIYDSTGVLLVLQHWRKPGHARWVPLLDTKKLDRLASGRKEETYWPVAVAQNAFHCIILKGGDRYPYFPRPLLSEFEFNIPISTMPRKESNRDEGDTEMDDAFTARSTLYTLQESLVRENVVLSLLEDRAEAPEETSAQETERRRKEVEIDKILLQLMAVECREGDERSMKAYEIVTLMKDTSGKMVDAAAKVAQRYDRTLLGEKIRALAEKRLLGEEDDGNADDDVFKY